MKAQTENRISKEINNMKEEIKHNLDHPRQLEKLYQDSKSIFKREFNLIYPDIQDSTTAQIWHARLNFENEEISWGTGKEMWFVIVASFMAGMVAKIPDFTQIDPEVFYPRNLSFIVFPFLTAYFAWKQKIQMKRLLFVLAIFLILFSIAEAPQNPDSKIGAFLLFGLAFVTVIINGIALSAILFRISEWGITPNRFAVLGGNMLILTNLFIVTYKLFKTLKDENDMERVEKGITSFLPIYTAWALLVTFIFPILFGFK